MLELESKNYVPMSYPQAVEIVKTAGYPNGLLEGMELIKFQHENTMFDFEPVSNKYIQAYNIVWKGMNKLFNG